MTPQQIVAVALRLFAVWLALQALRTVPALFTVRGFESPGYVWWTFMLGVSLLVILTLWFFPRTIAGKLVPPSDAEPPPTAAPEVWLAVGCTLLGLWVLTTTLPRILYNVIALNDMPSYENRSELQHWILYDFGEVAIAVWLVLGAKGVGKVFRWAQNVGVRKDL